jgi:hypothetical protein
MADPLAKAAPPALPLFVDTQVQIAAVPTEIAVARLTMEGRTVNGLQATTPTGVAFYFLDPAQAKKVAEALEAVASGVLHAPSLASVLAARGKVETPT